MKHDWRRYQFLANPSALPLPSWRCENCLTVIIRSEKPGKDEPVARPGSPLGSAKLTCAERLVFEIHDS